MKDMASEYLKLSVLYQVLELVEKIFGTFGFSSYIALQESGAVFTKYVNDFTSQM